MPVSRDRNSVQTRTLSDVTFLHPRKVTAQIHRLKYEFKIHKVNAGQRKAKAAITRRGNTFKF